MNQKATSRQPDLFDMDEHPTAPIPAEREQLAVLVEALQREIIAALAAEGVDMTKITADHLARAAFVYIRQSTADQLVHNRESLRRQYGLADRGKQLGWGDRRDRR
jgi:hypothetical protein